MYIKNIQNICQAPLQIKKTFELENLVKFFTKINKNSKKLEKKLCNRIKKNENKKYKFEKTQNISYKFLNKMIRKKKMKVKITKPPKTF